MGVGGIELATKKKEELVKLDVRIVDRIWGNGTYAVYEAELLNAKDVIQDDVVQFGGTYTTTITGNFDKRFFSGEEYFMYGTYFKHPKYEDQYKIQFVKTKVDTPQRIKEFLLAFCAENIVSQMMDKYGANVVQHILDGTFDYSDIKGMGEVRFNSLLEKVKENEYLQDLIVVLGDYGITPLQMKRIANMFGARAIKEIQDNPYVLCKITGIGFLRADEIARRMDFDMESPFRIQEAIKYVLGQNNMNGHTWMAKKSMLAETKELLGMDMATIHPQIEQTEGIVVVNDRIALQKIYDNELYIANRLKEIFKNSTTLKFDTDLFIDKYEEKNNVKLTSEQRSFFDNFKISSVNYLIGYAGCVDMDTEFFDGTKWKKISEYSDGDRVLQYNEDGTTSLVEPIRYIKLPETKMTFIRNKSGSINQCLSDEHTVVYKTSKGNLGKIRFDEMADRHNKNKMGFNGRFITTFEYNGNGINLTNDEIRVMTMVIADGHFPNQTNICRVNLKKQRKKYRIEELLNNANIPFDAEHKADGYTVYHFQSPLRMKKFESMWYNCTKEQLEIICDEVLHWDGTVDSKNRKSFCTTEKESADFIQFAFSCTGFRSTINIDDRVGEEFKGTKYIRKSISYRVIISNEKLVSLMPRRNEDKASFSIVEPVDGYKYCFTLPSGMWVMRRNNRICVTGNCGKSFLQKMVLQIANMLGMSVKLLAPTGKASKVLEEYTGFEAFTIHRAVGWMGGEEPNAYLQEEIIIVDESSMADIQIVSILLEALKNPNVRVFFVGDDFQIPSVGAGNFLYDCRVSGVFPVTRLTQVFRQAEGGALDVITKVRTKEYFIDNNFFGKIEFGTDCIIHSVQQKYMEDGYKFYYKDALKQGYSPEDIVILTPTKKGVLGTVAINKVIQSLVNPASKDKKEVSYGLDTIFRQGDQVINIKNTYRVFDIDDQEQVRPLTVVNGDVGVIYDIDTENQVVIVDYGFAKIAVLFGGLDNIIHRYAMTTHKSQGSGFKFVIVIADKAHKWQLNANLLYTALTRMKEQLRVICQADVINSAMKKNVSLERNTFLEDFLKAS